MKDIEKWIAEINPHEMALRIAEAACQMKRNPNKSADENMKDFIAADKWTGEGFYRAAWAAAKYLEDAINDYKKVQ